MADYKGLNIVWRADATEATKALHLISQEAKTAQGQLTAAQNGLNNLATNGRELNDALKSTQLQAMGDAARLAGEKARAYSDILGELSTKLYEQQQKLVANRDALEAMPAKYDGLANSATAGFERVAAAQQRLNDVNADFAERVAEAQAKVDEATERAGYAANQQDWVQAVNDRAEAERSLNAIVKEQAQAQAELNEAVATGDAKFDELSKTYGTLEGAVNAASEQIESIGGNIQRTTANWLEAESQAKSLEERVRVMGDVFAASMTSMYEHGENAKKWGDSMRSVGDSIASVGDKMSIVSGVALATFGKKVISATEDFGNSISQLGGYLDISGSQLESMSEQALQWGADTQFSATEAANAMNELAKGGMTQAQISGGAMAATMQLAAAGQLDMASAANTAVQAINVFNMDAADAASVADALAGAANKSTAEVSDLAQGFSQIGSAAGMAGWNMNEVTGALALLADRGFSGAEAGTTLKTTLQRLASPTKKAAETMQGLGIEVYGADGKMKDALDVIGQFEQALDGLTDEERNKALLDIFGMRGINGMTALLAEGTEGFRAYIDATEQAGYASEMAQSRMGDLGWALEYMRGELETATVNLGQALAPTIIDVAEKIEGLTSWFNSLSEGQQQFIAKCALMVTATGPVLSVFGHVMSGIGGMVSAFGTGAQTLATFAQSAGNGASAMHNLAEAYAKVTGPAEKVVETTAAIERGMTSLATGAVVALGLTMAGRLVGYFTEYVEHADLVRKATAGIDESMRNAEQAMSTWSTGQGATNAFKVLAESATEAQKALQGVGDYVDGVNDKLSQIGSDTHQLEAYADTIKELANKSGITAGEVDVLKDAVNRFNSIAGTSIQVINDQTGALSLQPEAIDRVTEAYERQVKAQAYLDLWQEAIKEQAKVEQELAKATEEVTAIQDKYSIKLGDSGYEISMLIGGAFDNYRRLSENKDALEKSNENLIASIDKWKSKAEEAGGAVAEYDDLLSELGIQTSGAADAADGDADALEDLADASTDAADAQEQLRRDIEDATTALKRQNDEAYTTAKRQAEDDYKIAKDGYERKYNELKTSLDRDYKQKADAYKRDEDAQKEANSRAEDELKKSLAKKYDLQKDAYAEEYKLLQSSLKEQYDLQKQAFKDEYDAAKSAMSDEYSARKSALDKEYSAQKDAYSKELSAYKEALSKMADAQKDADAKALSQMKSAHSAQEAELKKSLDSQYKIRQKEYAKVYKEWQKENAKILKAAKAADKAETDAFKQATKERVAAIKSEYEEKKRLYALNDGTAEIDAQIKAIEDQQAAEDEARKQRERAEKTAELQRAVDQAKTKRTRIDAETALSEYLNQLAEEDADAERQREIQRLKDKRDGIAEQTAIAQEAMDAERDARIADYERQREDELAAIEERQNAAYEKLSEKLDLELELRKEKQDLELEQYRESLDNQLVAMQEAHQREQDAFSEQAAQRLEAIQAENAARAEAMAQAQAQMLEQLKGQHESELSAMKATQEQQLKDMAAAQDQQLKDMASLQEQELANLSSTQETELENLKSNQERELQAAKDINEKNLSHLKDTNDTSLQSIKDSNDQILQKMAEDNDTALTDLKRKQDDALTELKNKQSDAVTQLKRDMEDGKTSVETNSGAASNAVKKAATDSTSTLKTEGGKQKTDADTNTKAIGNLYDTLMSNVSGFVTTKMPQVTSTMKSETGKEKTDVDDKTKDMGSLYEKMFDKFGTKSKSEMPKVSTTMSTETGKQKTDVDKKTGEMGAAYDKLFDGLGAKVQKGMNDMSTAFSSDGQRAATSAQGVANQIVGAFDGVPSQLERTGYNAGIGFNNGLASSSQQIYNTAQEIANNVANTMNSALQVQSPSRVTMRTGMYVDEGLIVGMERRERDVMMAARSISDSIADNVTLNDLRTQLDGEMRRLDATGGLADALLDTDLLKARGDEYLATYRTMINEMESLTRGFGESMRETWARGAWALGGLDLSGTVNRVTDALTSALGGMRFAGGGGVTIVMNGTTVREDADIPRIANEVVRRIAREDAMAIGRR